MELKDLTIAFLGDSITEGIGASSPDLSYPSFMERNTDIKKALNYGISGTRISRQTKTFMHYKEWDRDFISRVDEIDADADCVVVCGGINDYMHGDAKLGCFDDRSEYTFYGALHMLICSLIKKFPDKPIVFMTPVHFVAECSPDCAHINKGPYFSEYLKAIKEVCSYYSVPVFDLYKTSGMNPNIREQKDIFYSDDTHLNDNGYKRIAERLESFLKAL